MCENRHSLRVGAGFVIDSGRHGHARGSCRTYGRKERAHRSLQNHRTVLHKLPHASSSCPIRRPKHQNLSGCWVATHRFCGGGVYYYPNIRGGLEQAITNWALGVESGLIFGGAAALAIATSGDRTIYAGQFEPFIPFKERSPGLKYGGAALAITGALVAGLWSDVPVMNALTLAPTVGGLRVGTSFGF